MPGGVSGLPQLTAVDARLRRLTKTSDRKNEPKPRPRAAGLPTKKGTRRGVPFVGNLMIANRRLPLGELEPTPRAALAVLLPFLHPAVARQEPGVTQRNLQAVVVLRQG